MEIKVPEPQAFSSETQLVFEVPVTLKFRVAAGQERDAVDFANALAYLGALLVQECGHQEEARRMANVLNVSVPFEVGNPEYVKLGCRRDPVTVYGYAVAAEEDMEFESVEVAVG